jgi:hypothetical protein
MMEAASAKADSSRSTSTTRRSAKAGWRRRKFAACFSADETFDTGLDSASPVSADYQSRFRFPGTVDRVEIDLESANLSQTDVKKLEAAQLRALLGHE